MRAAVNTEEEVKRRLLEGDRRDELVGLMRSRAREGVLDVGAFRRESPREYGRLSACFGSVGAALKAAGLVKKDARASLTQRLAHDFLDQLRQEHTLKEIGDRYGVSRMAVCKLQEELREAVGKEEEEGKSVG